MNVDEEEIISPDDLTPAAHVRMFDRKHGDYVRRDHVIFYVTGAQRDCGPWPCLIPPPKDPKKLAKNQLAFWEAKLQFARDDFNNFKHSLLQAPSRHCQNAKENVTKLEALRETVLACKRAVEECRERLEDRPKLSEAERRQQAEEVAAEEEARRSFKTAIKAIQI